MASGREIGVKKNGDNNRKRNKKKTQKNKYQKSRGLITVDLNRKY